MTNNKYEITDIAHEEYPWLRRIRALRQIREDVPPGRYGGYIEAEENLDTHADDTSWVYDNSIVCNDAFVTGDSILRGGSVAKDSAYIAKSSVVENGSVVMEYGTVQDGHLIECAIVAGNGMVVGRDGYTPFVSDEACVYGRVVGNVSVTGKNSVVLSGEELNHLFEPRALLTNGMKSIAQRAVQPYTIRQTAIAETKRRSAPER